MIQTFKINYVPFSYVFLPSREWVVISLAGQVLVACVRGSSRKIFKYLL